MGHREALPECLRDSSVAKELSPRKNTLHYVNEDHSANFFANLSALRRDELHSDVKLVAKCRHDSSHWKIPAHKIVLMASCPYFSAMFRIPMTEATAAEVVLKDIDGDALLQLVDFMYTGAIEIDEDNVQYILSTANILQLTGVKQACSRFLGKNISVTNCLGIAFFAHLHSCSNLHSAARAFIQRNFLSLLQTEEFLSLSVDQLSEILQDDRLAAKEETVFEALNIWILHDLKNRKGHAPQLLATVRFNHLSDHSYIFSTIQKSEIVEDSIECKDILLEACRSVFQQSDDEKPTNWTRARKPPAITDIIMLIGGQDPKAMRDVDVFDPQTSTWTSAKPLPNRNCRSGTAVFDGKVYVIGGFNGSSRLRTVEVYDPSVDCWTSGPVMKERRETLGVAVHKDRNVIFAVGGFDGNMGLKSVEMWDPRIGEWQTLTFLSTRRSSVCATVLHDQLYAIGGYDGSNRQCLDTVEIFDIRNFRWKPGPTLHDIRSGATAVTIEDKYIFVAGGHDGPIVKDTVEILDEEQWHDFAALNEPRRNADMVVANGQLLVIGGDNGYTNMASIEMLKITKNLRVAKWETQLTPVPRPRSYASAAVLPKSFDSEWSGMCGSD